MSTRGVSTLALVAVVAILIGWPLVYPNSREPDPTLTRKAAAFDDFCARTESGVRLDLATFESADPRLQADAGERVLRDVIYHGDSSIRACLGDRMFEVDHWCRINENFKCLAEQARAYLTALERK